MNIRELTGVKAKKISSSLPELLIIVGDEKQISKPSSYAAFETDLQDHIASSLKRKKEDWKPGALLRVVSVEDGQPEVVLLALPKNQEMIFLLEFARNALKSAVKTSTRSVGVMALNADSEAHVMEAFGAALAARLFLMPVYGRKKAEQKAYQLKNVTLISKSSCKKNWEYGFETAEGSNLVRRLGFLPPNELNPELYGNEIRSLCRKHKLQVKFYGRSELKKMGAGAFLAVDRAVTHSKSGIYEITYKPSRSRNKKPIALVGKGLCYDTGGYDIKTGGYMLGMKGDMQGSAVALSTILTIARLKLPLQVKAYLAVTENLISEKAYKADEVVTAMNGMAIEVVNTDAEGRMALADTLTMATKSKPELCIDFATLTGAAVYSIGTRYSAGFTNREAYHQKIIQSGKASGERVWTFPLDEDYGKQLDSEIADILQCSKGKGVDHILAAYFLQKFVENDTPWIHIDLSAAENKGGLAHVDTEYSGFGVRFSLEFLRKHYLLP